MKRAITIFVLAAASSVSFAQGLNAKPVGPWYVGISGGQSRADFDDWDFYDTYTYFGGPINGLVTLGTDTRDTAWRIYGGYNFNQYWAVEGAYTDLGRIKAHYSWSADGTPLFEVTGDQVAWSAALKGALPINNQFDVFGLLGMTSNRTKVTFNQISVSLAGGVPSGSDHRTDLLTAVGAEFKPNPNIGLRLEYQNYNTFGGSDQNLKDTLRMEVDAWMLGANVKF